MNGWIEIVAGTLGGGKTMHGVERAFDHLLKGCYVFGNVAFKPDRIAAEMASRGYEFDAPRLSQLNGKSLDDFHTQIARGTNDSQVMVLIDEAHLEWNSRDYQTTKSDPKARAMLNFITFVRKLDIILVFITQSPEDIDKQLRKKASLLTMCRNFKNFRLGGVFPLPIPLMSRVTYDISIGNKKPERINFEIFQRPKWVCELYDSDALTGKAQDTFGGLRTVKARPLNRIARVSKPSPKTNYATVAGLAAAASCASSLIF